MKRSIFAFLVLLGSLVISIASPLIYNHYVNETYSLTGDAQQVSVVAEEAVAQVLNPVFTTVDEALQFRQQEIEQHYIDSVFCTIPQSVVKTITTVLLGRTGTATKLSIVEEFKKSYADTYQFITPTYSAIPQNNSHGDTLKLPPSVTKDTIINGEAVKIIKETVNNG